MNDFEQFRKAWRKDLNKSETKEFYQKFQQLIFKQSVEYAKQGLAIIESGVFEHTVLTTLFRWKHGQKGLHLTFAHGINEYKIKILILRMVYEQPEWQGLIDDGLLDLEVLEHVGSQAKEDAFLSDWTIKACLRVVVVPKGSFVMGAEEGLSYPEHTVELTRSFELLRLPMLKGMYNAINQYENTQKLDFRYGVEPCWLSKIKMINIANKLSDIQGYTRAYTQNGNQIFCNFDSDGYRLPTEAEWEYGYGFWPLNMPKGGQLVWDHATLYDDKDVCDPIGPQTGHLQVIRGGLEILNDSAYPSMVWSSSRYHREFVRKNIQGAAYLVRTIKES